MILTQKKCVPDVVKDLNVKVFNLMSRTNETRHMKWHKTCKYECRLDSIVCNNKQRWNKNKYPRFVHVFIEKKKFCKKCLRLVHVFIEKKKIFIKSVPGLFG